MGKLHEVLAVEGDLKEKSEKLVKEAVDTFSKRDTHFTSYLKSYKADSEQELPTPEESKPMVETVKGKLAYVGESLQRYLDAVYQKELANTQAKADLILADGTVLAQGIPAQMLLTIENKLKGWRQMYEAIPTLAPGEDWKMDSKTGNYVAEESKIRTAKVFKNHIKSHATDKHPEQVELYQQDERVGVVKTVKQSSMLSPVDKSKLLANLDSLIHSAKQARMRANTVEAPVEKIGETLLKHIHSF